MFTKYIVVIDKFDTECIIVFPNMIYHKDMVCGRTVISAGFIDFDTDPSGKIVAQCFGESTSLNLESRPFDDSRLANYQILKRR